MSVFTPCIAVSKARLNATPVADGQLIIVLDSGELYFDYNNRRIQLAKNTSSSDAAETSGNPFIFCIVNADTKVSGSLAAGGGGSSGGSTDDTGGGDSDVPPVCADSYGTPEPITPGFTEYWPVYPIVHGNLSI